MNVRFYDLMRCLINVRLWLTSMIDVWLGMIDVMLCVLIHVSVCVCVCVCELDNNIECAFNRVRT